MTMLLYHSGQWVIVQEPHHEDYKEAAMDAYINMHLEGFCQHAVSNEFFDNRPGVYTCM